MFTGIVEELGTVKKIKKGDSVAVNGICLTVTACLENGFTADVMHETLNRSALIQLSPGQHVNWKGQCLQTEDSEDILLQGM